jgi:Transglycosylase SLT domain
MDDYWSKAVDVDQMLDKMVPVESSGNPKARSSKGARGLLQVMPATAAQYGIKPDELYNPETNRHVARRYLTDMLVRYRGDKIKALAAYNAGPSKVDKGEIPHETHSYISRILGAFAPAEAEAAGGPPKGTVGYWDKATVESSKSASVGDYWAGARLDPSAGSVFSRPETTGEKLKSAGKTAVELGVGVGLPLAASAVVGPEAAIPVKIGAQALAGAATPYAEAGTAKLMGDEPGMPGWRDALHSAAWNAGLTSVGEGISTLVGGAAAVRPELEAFPGPQSRATIKQSMRNRDFFKRMGLNDAQIDDIIKKPDLQAELARQIQSGQKYKQAFQSVLKHTRGTFAGQYNAILGTGKELPAEDIGQMMEGLAQGKGQHEITPALRAFLQRKGLELTRAGETTGPSVGGVPWKQLPEKFKEQLRTQGVAQGISAPSSNLSLQDLQGLRTELRENVPASATPLDKQVVRQINEAISTKMKSGMTASQAKALDATDADYGRFMDMVEKLDPRSERYGEQVANAMFDPMVKNPGDALKFVDLAQMAEQARPGKVMPQLREAFLNKIMSEARTPGEPIEELRALRKIQNTWGTDKNARTVMSGIFGKDSPLADPAAFAKVLGTADNPRSIIDAIGQKPGRMHSILSSPYMQAYATAGFLMSASGIQGGGLWSSLMGQKGPQAQVLAALSMALGPAVIGKVITGGNATLQRAMVGAMTNPNAKSVSHYLGALSGATAGGLISLPGADNSTSEASTTESVR